jgi:hypothetical protein
VGQVMISTSVKKLMRLTILVASLFSAAACNDSPATNESPNSIVGNNTSITEAVVIDYEVIPERQTSPLDEYLNLVNDFSGFELLDPDTQIRILENNRLRREEFIATCMQRFGFDYTINFASFEFIPAEPEKLGIRKSVPG